MTDLLLQAKDRLIAAELAYQEADAALTLAMHQLTLAQKERSEAQNNFEIKTLNYSLAIQNANNLEAQPYLSEQALIAANRDLDVTKKEYDAAQGINQAQETISQAAFHAVVQAQAVYDATKLAFDGANYDYARILRERKLPLLGEVDLPDQTETPPENIDFLMQFLSQHPLPDYEENDDLINLPEDEATYDTSLPFERRPAIERPPSIQAPQVTLDETNRGHIMWQFDTIVPPDTENEMENATDD